MYTEQYKHFDGGLVLRCKTGTRRHRITTLEHRSKRQDKAQHVHTAAAANVHLACYTPELGRPRANSRPYHVCKGELNRKHNHAHAPFARHH